MLKEPTPRIRLQMGSIATGLGRQLEQCKDTKEEREGGGLDVLKVLNDLHVYGCYHWVFNGIRTTVISILPTE